MNKELLKATIIKQWKDPKSVFNCLLCTSEYSERPREGSSSLSVRPVSLYCSQFILTITFRWELEAKYQDFSIVFPSDKLVQQVLFSSEGSPSSLDISNEVVLGSQGFIEEFVQMSGETLILGLNRFHLKHNEYLFYKVYDNEVYHLCVLNMKTKEFSEKEYLIAHEWTKARNGKGSSRDEIYIDWEPSEEDIQEIMDFMRDNDWSEDEISANIVHFKSKSTNVLPTLYWIYKGISEHYPDDTQEG